MKLDNVKLDTLANDYLGGNEFALNNLRINIDWLLNVEARKAISRARNQNIFIPVEDFLSAYNEAFWQAIQGFDGSSHFIQRLRTYMKYREADVWRSYQYQEDGEIKYDKARNKFLDDPIVLSDGEQITLGDLVLSEFVCASAEEIATGMSVLVEALKAYKNYNPKYYKIISMLALGAINKEITLVVDCEM